MFRRLGFIFCLAFMTATVAGYVPARADDRNVFAVDATIVPTGMLAELRGGAQADAILENLRAELSGNTVTGNYSGTNMISGGAFAGANGVFNTFQNFGNNVIYQSVINVSVTSVPQ